MRLNAATTSKLNELVVLLNGDKQAVKRLVLAAMSRYPHHPAAWYVEKVMSDLTRDRGVR
ncbi:MAG TPA: hypothetical protein IGS53_08515 [Leptolyngbyaceae cyanobacterium M33_DOE_097]|uniref:HEAT repeat domain-containing protein n=1 Tax=Oscillatoriales cyanobacterium SpSt-418 TaxID=2282169 RepID=A0A7C3KDN9_9CYAN|nr:hypothetical protein [Leptolyngbyaceae cyanobacterium M33_DOE_097]